MGVVIETCLRRLGVMAYVNKYPRTAHEHGNHVHVCA
jgi:hypothetical protein